MQLPFPLTGIRFCADFIHRQTNYVVSKDRTPSLHICAYYADNVIIPIQMDSLKEYSRNTYVYLQQVGKQHSRWTTGCCGIDDCSLGFLNLCDNTSRHTTRTGLTDSKPPHDGFLPTWPSTDAKAPDLLSRRYRCKHMETYYFAKARI